MFTDILSLVESRKARLRVLNTLMLIFLVRRPENFDIKVLVHPRILLSVDVTF